MLSKLTGMALEAQSTNCPAGQAYQISTTSAFKQVLIADNCDELICPKGYACFSGAAFTHCCPEHPLSDGTYKVLLCFFFYY